MPLARCQAVADTCEIIEIVIIMRLLATTRQNVAPLCRLCFPGTTPLQILGLGVNAPPSTPTTPSVHLLCELNDYFYFFCLLSLIHNVYNKPNYASP